MRATVLSLIAIMMLISGLWLWQQAQAGSSTAHQATAGVLVQSQVSAGVEIVPTGIPGHVEGTATVGSMLPATTSIGQISTETGTLSQSDLTRQWPLYRDSLAALQRGLVGKEWEPLTAVRAHLTKMQIDAEAERQPENRRVRGPHAGVDGTAPFILGLETFVRTGAELADDPAAPDGKSIQFTRNSQVASREITLSKGRYEVIMPAQGTNTYHDALYVELGGQQLRMWGGWGHYAHFSHAPTIVIAPQDGVYELSISSTEELGVSLGGIQLIPLDAQGEGQLLRAKG